ncbi:MAG TPA: hypothetical protein VKO84_01200, partial [Gaiellaceae bacterium]|nr:hypothetical protein [Gaiellaceae bacterium]
MRHQVAERARAGGVSIEPPGVERRVVAPVLQATPAEVARLAELARVLRPSSTGRRAGEDDRGALVSTTAVLRLSFARRTSRPARSRAASAGRAS